MNIPRDVTRILAATCLLFASVLAQAQTPPPTISSFLPSSGNVGGNIGVTITGTNMSTVTTVMLDSTPASIIRQTATTVTVAAPAHAAGAVNVIVTNPSGSFTASGGFTYVTDHDLARDFSIWSNPTSRWLYGKAAAPGFVVSNYASIANVSGNDHWYFTPASAPTLWRNSAATAVSEGTHATPSMVVGLLPGPAGEYSVAQWKAPADGTYSVSFSFFALDPGTSSSVAIVKNGTTTLHSASVTAGFPSSTFLQVTLAAGGTLDFAVGDNGSTSATDATALAVTITQVPMAANVVTNTNDSGPGSLRAALTYFTSSNCDTAIYPAAIEFLISGPGPHTISPLTPLPILTCGIQLDGYTQDGASANTDSGGSNNANIKIILNGQSCVPAPATATCNGVESIGSNARISGLAIRSFSGAGIRIAGGSADIYGNYIGTDPGGETDFGNGDWGVRVDGGDAYIGFQGAAQKRNLITGNSFGGVRVGVGTSCLPAMREPVAETKLLKVLPPAYAAFYYNQIGGTRGGGNSVFNSGPGVYFEDSSTCGTYMIENYIRYNEGPGVVLAAGTALQLQANFIHGNKAGGVPQTAFDLGNNGVSPNDTDDVDSGANNLLNSPTITSVSYAGSNVTIGAELRTSPSLSGTAVRFDLFHNSTSPIVPEGEFYMGSGSGTIDASGLATMSPPVTIAGFPGQNITATATICPTCFFGAMTSEYSFPKTVAAVATTAFTPASIPLGSSSILRVTLTNPNAGATLTGVGFTLTVPVGLTVGSAAANIGCQSGYGFMNTSTDATLSNLTIPASGTCTLDITVTTSTPQTYTYFGPLTVFSSAGTSTNASSTSLSVNFTPPTFAFSAATTATVGVGASIGLSASRGPGSGTYGGLTASLALPSGATVTGAPGTSCGANTSGTTLGGTTIAANGGNLVPNSGCTLVTAAVTFATPGTYTLQVNTGAFSMSTPTAYSNSSPITHTIVVSGVPAAILTGPGSFGNIQVGSPSTLNATLQNNGTAPLNISSLSASGPFTVGSCGSSVAPSATCTFSVTFTPTTAGSQSGTLTLVSDAPGSPHAVALSGTGTVPGISLAPSPADFGSVVVNTTSTLNVAVNNTGAAPLVISAISVTGSFFTQSGTTCPPSLPVGNACFIAVVYSPTATGLHTGQLSVSSNAPGSPHLVALSGTGTAPGVSLTPSPVAFGNVPVGGNANATLNLSNTGTAPLLISSIVTTGTFFTNTTNCGSSLPATASCQIVVVYAPTAAGSHTGQVSVTTNAGAGPVVAPLSGTGAVPVLALTGTGLTFGSQTVGTASLPQTITINNNGGAPLDITAITPSGDFNFTGCPTPLSIAPGAGCTLSIKFVPTAVGARTGGISIASNAAGSPHGITLSGDGTPVPVPGIALAPTSADFGALVVGTNATQVLGLSNPGTAPLAISSIAASGAGFSQTNACPASLSPSASCNINVTFAPGVTGPASGQLAIVSNAAPSPLNAALTGSGLPATTAGITFSPTSVAFPAQFVGTTSASKTVTLTSSGTAPLVISQVTGGGDFSFTGCGPSTLAPNATCTFTITFRPQSVGSLTGSIVVTSNAAGSPHSLALSGNGASLTAPEIVIAPSAFAFGTLRTARTATLVGRLNNTGAAPLLISQIQATGAFFTQSNNCPATVAVGGFCDITVTYAPTATGAHSGQLAIHSNAIPSPHVAALSGTGINVPPPFLSTSGDVSFGQQQVGTTVRRTLVLTNTGGDPLVISSMALIGSGAFGVEGGCGTIAPEASCALTAAFLPTGVNTFNARLDIVSNHSGGVVQVQLSGQGVPLPQPDLDFSVGALGFGNQTVGSRSSGGGQNVRLTNIGGAPVSISAIRSTLSDFVVSASQCIGTLAPRAFCDINVVFGPFRPGPLLGSLVVDSSPTQGDSVSLIGVGCRIYRPGRSAAGLCSP